MNVLLNAMVLANGDFLYVWREATAEGKIIIIFLVFLSIFAWSIMASKTIQLRRANRLNHYFNAEFRGQSNLLAIYERKVVVEGCPLFTAYRAACAEIVSRLKGKDRTSLSPRAIEHVSRTLERTVAEESLRLESNLIILAIAVSGAPFLGLLGTVWGVMAAFTDVAMKGSPDLATLAPGVAAALTTTVAGLLVAIPAMFGYNWLVHHLRVMTVELDNFAQELVTKIETEFGGDE